MIMPRFFQRLLAMLLMGTCLSGSLFAANASTVTTLEISGTSTVDAKAHADAYNLWMTKRTQTLPNGTQKIVYCNHAAQVLVKITREAAAPDRELVDAYRYDNAGREIWHATPSAITGYNAATVQGDPFLGFDATGNTSKYVKATDGVILERIYSGGVDGKLWKEMSRQGKNGTQVVLRELK